MLVILVHLVAVLAHQHVTVLLDKVMMGGFSVVATGWPMVTIWRRRVLRLLLLRNLGWSSEVGRLFIGLEVSGIVCVLFVEVFRIIGGDRLRRSILERLVLWLTIVIPIILHRGINCCVCCPCQVREWRIFTFIDHLLETQVSECSVHSGWIDWFRPLGNVCSWIFHWSL